MRLNAARNLRRKNDRSGNSRCANAKKPLPSDWKPFEIYESGKDRRYKLLFTVNGGAYALIGFLVSNGHALDLSPVGIWAFIIIPIALGAYSYMMCDDIDAFAKKMKAYEPDELYGPEGLRHLCFIRWFFVGWALAVVVVILQWAHVKSW